MGRMEFYPGDYLHSIVLYLPYLHKKKLAEKRRLRKEWNRTRTPLSKKLRNRATQDLKQLLHQHKNANIQKFLHGLTPTASTDYSFWKTTKKIKNSHATFCINSDVTRNMGTKQCWKCASLRQPPCHCIPTSLFGPQLHSWSHPYITIVNPFPTRPPVNMRFGTSQSVSQFHCD
jgi:hypothetical protein